MQDQSTYMREFYAITEVLANFRQYVLGKHFIIQMEQQSLKMLLDQ